MAPLHHDVSEKDLNLGLFQEAARLDHRTNRDIHLCNDR